MFLRTAKIVCLSLVMVAAAAKPPQPKPKPALTLAATKALLKGTWVNVADKNSTLVVTDSLFIIRTKGEPDQASRLQVQNHGCEGERTGLFYFYSKEKSEDGEVVEYCNPFVVSATRLSITELPAITPEVYRRVLPAAGKK